MSADLKTIKGTETILTKLTIAVSETESATSPFANLVKTRLGSRSDKG